MNKLQAQILLGRGDRNVEVSNDLAHHAKYDTMSNMVDSKGGVRINMTCMKHHKSAAKPNMFLLIKHKILPHPAKERCLKFLYQTG